MITDLQRELIIAAYGKQYTKSVIDSLCAARIFTNQSKAFSPSVIKKIVNGFYEHETVETHILTSAIVVLEEKKKFQKEISKKAKHLLNQ